MVDREGRRSVGGDSPDVPERDDERHWLSEVVDLSTVSPSALPDSVLRDSLRRLAAELDDPDEPIAGFNSAL
jgi:FXSXX-COOH protein